MRTRVWCLCCVLVLLVYADEEPVLPEDLRMYMESTNTPFEWGANPAEWTFRFNRTAWKEHRPDLEFNLHTWNWAALDVFLPWGSATVELIFNGLDMPHIDGLGGHDTVTGLNLNDNQIVRIESEAFANFPHLEHLSLRNNLITSVDNAFFFYRNEFQRLDLSANQVTDLNGFKRPEWSRMTHLNLSHNDIRSVRTHLAKLESLEWVDLSHNRIEVAKPSGDKMIILPRNLEQLRLDHNLLTVWPFDAVPGGLRDLSMSFNEINSTKPAIGLRRLDLSYNRLEDFCSSCFPNVEELNLSGNILGSVPRVNDLTDPWPLRKLVLNHMPQLSRIEQYAFEGADNLEEFDLTFCPLLTEIKPHTFAELHSLIRLNLSYNRLSEFPENIANWNRLEQGVDLQGNPINCICSMQWLLDRVIPGMHANRELHKLFPNLRCAGPQMYKDQLVVHLTVHENMMCRKLRDMNLPGMEPIVNTMKDHNRLWWNQVSRIVLIVLIVCNILVGAYLIRLKCLRKRKIVRPKILY